jgi:hypothetical protein
MTDQGKIAAPRDAALPLRGYRRASRFLVMPLIALAVIGGIAGAGVIESRAARPATCGLVITVQDPDLRASFIRFDQQQSAGARKLCALYRDRH